MKVTTDACLFGAWAATEIEKEKWKMKTCFDIGTGTGLLSLMMTQKNNILIDAIEIDEEAAEQAKENIAASSWAAQITVIRENVANCMPAKKYDCIISNPPFKRSVNSCVYTLPFFIAISLASCWCVL